MSNPITVVAVCDVDVQAPVKVYWHKNEECLVTLVDNMVALNKEESYVFLRVPCSCLCLLAEVSIPIDMAVVRELAIC
ncbi:unnamed protein product [Lactuca virosa]|uniref:Ig-like domain-containing protein n=1 Tax=Lactuca virosa TaxID=75947 RepID=A0AAU9P7I5_9ASTR|nr:unnamed protein product [Lactuca virosa]